MKKALETLIVLSILLIVGTFIYGITTSKNDVVYDCKVLETYHDAAGYKVSAKYTAVVHVIELDRNTSLNLSPENFYNAEQYKKSGKIVGYYFNNDEISRIKGENPDKTYAILFISGFLSLIIFLVWYSIKYVED